MFASRSFQLGATLVELVLFVVIVSIAVAGVLLVMNKVTAHSADPLLRKQALAIAESLLEEVELMPFTFCDPNDPKNLLIPPPANAAGCSVGLSQDVTAGPVPNTEARGSTANPYDNVADYGGYAMNGITDMLGNNIAGLGSYTASVMLTRAGTALLGVADNGAALLITVTVTAPDGTQVVLDGYRARYAPNGLP